MAESTATYPVAVDVFQSSQPPRRGMAEAQAAYRWYAGQDPAAAEAFVNELDDAIEQIGIFPKLAGPYVSATCRYVMRRFPFTVIYRELDEKIEIVAVAHGRRKPGYWRKRVKN